MGAASAGAEDRLRNLVNRAIDDFGVRCLWNVRTDLPVRAQAKIVYDQIPKHGGAEGMRLAVEIRDELAALGEGLWR